MELETQITKEFDDWFNDFYGLFSFRVENFYDDVEEDDLQTRRELLRKWMIASFHEGYERGLHNLLEQKEKAKQLALDLRYWSQNEEMIDQYFTEHGTVCNQAAELLEEFAK